MRSYIYLFSLISLIYFSCSNRGTDNINSPDLNPVGIADFLTTINPTEYGYDEQTAQGNFRKAIFIDFDANDVWAMYVVRNGQKERLSWEINIDAPLPFILHSDKYIDDSGIRHIAVTSGYPLGENQPISSMKVSIAKININEPLDDSFYNQFRIVQPVEFGNENITNNDKFIEAVFAGMDPIDIWAIIKTSSNGYKGKVNLARKINNAKNYYLLPSTYTDSNGTIVKAVKVGLNTFDFMEFSNIEVVVDK